MIKKIAILASLYMFLGFGGFAQSLSLIHGEEIVSNDTVYISGTFSDDLIELHVKVQNLTDKEIEVKVRKSEVSLVDGSVNTFCWGGSCFMPSVYTSPVSTKISANGTDLNSFAGDYYPEGIQGTSIITYTFFNVHNEEDSVMVTAFYQAGASGIEDFTLQKEKLRIYPNPVVDQVNIEFSALPENPYSVRLLNLNGQLIKELVNNSSEGMHSFNLGEISASFIIIEITDNMGFYHHSIVLLSK